MVLLPEASIRKKGRLGPGQMIAVDLDEGKLYDDRAIKDRIANAQDYAARVKGFRTMADAPRAGRADLPAFERAELLRRQGVAGLTMEVRELILLTMGGEGQEGEGAGGGR